MTICRSVQVLPSSRLRIDQTSPFTLSAGFPVASSHPKEKVLRSTNMRMMTPLLVLISMPPSSILDLSALVIGVGSDQVFPSSLLVRAPVGSTIRRLPSLNSTKGPTTPRGMSSSVAFG